MSYPSYYRHACTEVLNATKESMLLAWPGKREDETVLCRVHFNNLKKTQIRLTRKEALGLKRFLECLEPTTQAEVEQVKKKMLERLR